jgi:hypothetical protein
MSLRTIKKLTINYSNDNTGLSDPPDVPKRWEDFAPLCRIASGGKYVPFNPYDYQKDLNNIINKHRVTYVFKTRQLGITETVACKLLQKACLNPAYLSAVFSIGGDETKKVAKRIREMRLSLPDVKFATDSLLTLEVEGGGQILLRPSTSNAGRSLASVSDLLFDEAAHIEKIGDIYPNATAAQQMVGDKARVVVVSTPDGRANWFWQQFDKSNGDIDANKVRLAILSGDLPPFYWWTDDEGNAKVFIHWKAHPIYSLDPDYLINTKNRLGLTDQALQREYNFGLDDTDSTVFKSELVQRAARGAWSNPIRGRKYVIGVDPATGGADYFVAQVWDVSTKPFNLVAQYRDRRSTTHGIEQTELLCNKYRPIVLAVESNAAGAAIAESLSNKMRWQRVEPVVTTSMSKRINTDRLVILHEADDIIYPPDSHLPGELEHFVQDSKGRREASSGWHDDTVMAAAIALSSDSDEGPKAGQGVIRFS